MFIKPAEGIVFVERSLEQSFLSLKEDSPLKKSINKAMFDLKVNAFCGENIPKKLIPKEYTKKYRIDNLGWYPLANAWRLVYTITKSESIELLAVIIDYYSHKDYERKFKY